MIEPHSGTSSNVSSKARSFYSSSRVNTPESRGWTRLGKKHASRPRMRGKTTSGIVAYRKQKIPSFGNAGHDLEGTRPRSSLRWRDDNLLRVDPRGSISREIRACRVLGEGASPAVRLHELMKKESWCSAWRLAVR